MNILLTVETPGSGGVRQGIIYIYIYICIHISLSLYTYIYIYTHMYTKPSVGLVSQEVEEVTNNSFWLKTSLGLSIQWLPTWRWFARILSLRQASVNRVSKAIDNLLTSIYIYRERDVYLYSVCVYIYIYIYLIPHGHISN